MKRHKLKIACAIAFTLFVGAALFAWIGFQAMQLPRQAYAVWWTADLVIEHMEHNDGSWPRSWDELRLTSEKAHKGLATEDQYGNAIVEFRPRNSIDELQQLVEIDWSAEPHVLRNAEFKENAPPFRVIWLRNGKSINYSGKEPNEMILHYLKWKEKNSLLAPSNH